MPEKSTGSLVEELTCRRRAVLGAIAASAAVGSLGTATGQEDDDIHPVFGLPVGPDDTDPAVEPDHEVTLQQAEGDAGSLLENESEPFPARYFDPVGLAIDPGDVVAFFPGTWPQTITAYHPDLGFEQRIPDGVGPITSPVLTDGSSFLYRFEESGVYDLMALPFEWAGAVMRIVVGEATGPGDTAVPAPEYDTSIPDVDDPLGPDWLAATVLRDEALDPETILANGAVRWEDLDDESKRFPLRLLVPGGPTRTLAAALGGDQAGVDTAAVGSAKLMPVENGLLWHLVIEDIECVTQAHVHEGERDEEGEVLTPMVEYTDEPDGTGDGDPRSTIPAEPIVQGGVITDDQAVDAILEQPAEHYVNVHTAHNPDGEIRGQLRGGHPDDIPEREPEPADLTVSDLDEQVTVTARETFDISATITNEGDVTGTQTIEFRIDGDSVETQELELRCRESETVRFETTTDRDPGEYEHGVFTDDDEQTGTLVIDAPADDEDVDDDVEDDDDPAPAEFTVSALDPADVAVTQGDPFDVSATIENAGGEEGSQTVEYRIDGETITDRVLELDGGESETVTFEEIETEDLDVGDYEHGIFTDDGEATGTLSVVPEQDLVVSDLDPADVTISEGDYIDVSATLELFGDYPPATTFDIRYTIDGEPESSKTVALTPGEQMTVTFDRVLHVRTGRLDPGEYDHAIQDEAGTLTVEEPPESLLSELDPEEVTVTQGESFDVSVAVENIREVEIQREVNSLLAGESVGLTSIDIEAESTETLTDEFETGDLDPGEHEFGFRSAGVEVTGTVTVEADEPAAFTVSDLDPEDVTVDQGETISVSATIENTGGEADSQTVELQVDGELRAERELELDGGDEETVTLDTDTADLDPGEYEHSISTDDDSASGTLTVEEEAEDDEEDAEDDEEDAEDDEENEVDDEVDEEDDEEDVDEEDDEEDEIDDGVEEENDEEDEEAEDVEEENDEEDEEDDEENEGNNS